MKASFARIAFAILNAFWHSEVHKNGFLLPNIAVNGARICEHFGIKS